MDTNKITIGFHYVSEFGDSYDSSSTLEVFTDLGDTELSVIGEQLNAFLIQIGYFRKNNNIFMEDLDDEEYDAVADFLADYREKKESNT
ncbi:MAG: hypothetical protein Q3982_03470 [Phoenicibacter congonensis]|uniref:Uncharacterized protein n=1 Tax=Phoenicibacter congonensis TaxID=1944646 RepID=A0AA43RH37_9ACTN|nr:hypothetical protein [Phoenicibacter congonensis]